MIVYLRLGFLLVVFIAALLPNPASARGPRMACDVWPPYQQHTRHGTTGFSVEVIRAVYARMGEDMGTITMYPWARAVDALKTGEVDVLFSATFNKDRASYAYYPDEPLVITPWVVWGWRDSPLVSFEGLQGKRVGVILGYYYSEEFSGYLEREADIVEIVSDEQCFEMLHHGRVDYCAAELNNGRYIVRNLGLEEVVPNRAVTVKETGLYAVFSRKTTPLAFVRAFTEALREFKKTPEFERLYEKYLSH